MIPIDEKERKAILYTTLALFAVVILAAVLIIRIEHIVKAQRIQAVASRACSEFGATLKTYQETPYGRIQMTCINLHSGEERTHLVDEPM